MGFQVTVNVLPSHYAIEGKRVSKEQYNLVAFVFTKQRKVSGFGENLLQKLFKL